MNPKDIKNIIEKYCRGCISHVKCIETRKSLKITNKRLAEILLDIKSEEVEPSDPKEAGEQPGDEENEDKEVAEKECDIIRKLAGEKPIVKTPLPKPDEKKEPNEDKEIPTDDEIADFEDEFT